MLSYNCSIIKMISVKGRYFQYYVTGKNTFLLIFTLVNMLFFPFLNVFGQGPVITSSLPNVIQPSPQAMSILRFGDYPMNYGSGLPDIKIPVYEIKSGSLSLPVSFSFHASGCKLDPTYSLLGQDWTIEAGGVLSRTIRDKADDIYVFSDKTQAGISTLLNGSNPYMNINQIVRYEDKQYDVFNYHVNTGLDGKFVLKHSGVNGSTLTPKQLILSLDKIETTTTGSQVTGFRVTAENGVIYVFGKSGGYGYGEGSGSSPAISGYWLAHIISANLKDSINFKYTGTTNLQPQKYVETLVINDQFSGNSGDMAGLVSQGYDFSQPTKVSSSESLSYYSTSVNIAEIEFKEGKLNFESRLQGKVRVLSKLSVVRKDGKVIKSIVPSISNFVSAGTTYSDRVKVDNLQFTNPDTGQPAYTYNFDYYNDTNLGFPGNGNVGSMSTLSKDWMGFFNGNSGSLIPSTPNIPNWTGGDRSGHPEYAMQGMLKKIQFPTGGTTEFIYEGNKSEMNNIDGVAASYAPGLRLYQQIISDNPGNVAKRKTYQYATGKFSVDPYISNFGYKNYTLLRYSPNAAAALRQRIISSEMLPDLSTLLNTGIQYPLVTEYEGTTTDNTGKTEFAYGACVNGSFLNTTINSQFTTNNCGFMGGFQVADFDSSFNPKRVSWHPYCNNPLTSKKVYQKDAGGYTPVYSTATNYTTYTNTSGPVEELLLGQYIKLGGSYSDVISPEECLMANMFDFGAGGGIKSFFYNDTQVFYPGVRKISSQTETSYLNGVAAQVTTTNYQYQNTTYPQLTGTTKTDSKLLPVTTTYKYAYDFPSSSINLGMVGKNMISQTIEQTQTTNGKVTKQQTNYVQPFGGMYVPSTIDISNTITGLYETRLRYNSYDVNGNILSLKQESGSPISYKWGYRQQYPIAEAKNSAVNEIYSQNFEEPELGLDFEANVVNDNTRPHTGRYSGRIINPNATEFVSHSDKGITISLSAPKKFTYSGWVYSTGPSAQLHLFMFKPGETAYFSYVDAVQTAVINKWVYVKKEFLVPADVVYMKLRIDNNAAGTVWFDDLRIQPSDASMSTYTYEPLVGMTSAIDDSGKTVYYEYDSFQRLTNIKDQNGFIIKNYDYHYKP